MAEDALSYIRRGWAVFPDKGKIPLTVLSYQDTSIDEVSSLRLARCQASLAPILRKVCGDGLFDELIENITKGTIDGYEPRTR